MKKIRITPESNQLWPSLSLGSAYRDLLYHLTLRGLKARYAQTILGVAWAILQPLITSLIMTVVFGRIAQVNTGELPYLLFNFAALVPWTFFSTGLTEASGSLIQHAGMIGKVYFPRSILPASALLSKIPDLFISWTVLTGIQCYLGYWPGITWLLSPLLLLLCAALAFGCGLLLSALSVQYRDVKHALPFLIQLLLYTAPIVYPARQIPADWQWLYGLNPLVGIIEGFRACVLGQELPWLWLLQSVIGTLLILLLGWIYFKRAERYFADIA